MNFRELARISLVEDEGRVPHAYQDSEGYWTIGVGRLIDKRKGGKLRNDEIDLMLANDIDDAVICARALFPNFANLTEERKAVLVNMAFNLGMTNLTKFRKFREAVERQDWYEAAVQMLDSLWAKQVGARANRLAEKMRKG